jgi:hypothetical protein
MSRERFDWSHDNPDVVFRSYGDLAMHLNPYGDIVIRQNDPFDTDDPIVIVPIANADLFLSRFRELAEESQQYDWRPEGQPNAATLAPPEADRQQRLALPAPAPLNSKGQRVGASNG